MVDHALPIAYAQVDNRKLNHAMTCCSVLVVGLLLGLGGCRKELADVAHKAAEAGAVPAVQKSESGETFESGSKSTGARLSARAAAPRLVFEDTAKPQGILEWDERLNKLLAEVTTRESCNEVMGCKAGEELVAMGPKAAGPVIERYKTLKRPSYQKFHLIEILGEIGAPESLPFLRGLLDDKYWQARTLAAIALGRMNDRGSLEEMRRRLEATAGSEDWGYRYGLAFAITALGAKNASGVLLDGVSPEAVASRNWGYTRIAVAAVAQLGLKEACTDLQASIRHGDVFLKKEAIRAVAKLGCREPEVLSALLEQSDHVVPSVRREAARALDELRGDRVAKFFPLLPRLFVAVMLARAAKGGECPSIKAMPVPFVKVRGETCGMSIEVPASWDPEVVEHSRFLIVKDKTSACSIELSRSVSNLSATDARRIHENLYLGGNRLPEECIRKAGAFLNWSQDVEAGEYVLRYEGDPVHAVFARTGEEIIVIKVRCPGKGGKALSWAESLKIFSSFGVETPDEPRGAPVHGVLSPLYLFLNNPFNRLQNPTLGETLSAPDEGRR